MKDWISRYDSSIYRRLSEKNQIVTKRGVERTQINSFNSLELYEQVLFFI